MKLIILFLCSYCLNVNAQLSQMGTFISGEAEDDYAGRSVSLDSAGNTLVVGSNNNHFQRGYIKIFDWDGTAWIQRGNTIVGESLDNIFGSCTSISADGNIVAAGAPYNTNLNGAYAGHVRVYKWNGTAWSKIGADIDGLTEYDQLGTSVSLDASGTTVAVGAKNDNTNFEGAGKVQIFDWNGSSWIQRGDGILGLTTGDGVGSAVSLSSDGNTVAIGAAESGANWSFAGKTMIYDWNGTAWIKRGSDITGEFPEDNSGISVDLNSEGNSIVIGALKNNQNAGQARIYDWNGTAWIQRGQDIDGDNAGDWSGRSVAMSDDGNTVAIGSEFNDESATDAGKVRIFDWNGTVWEKRSEDILGITAGNQTGYSVSISANGKIIASGNIMDDGDFPSSGSVSVYSYCFINTGTTLQGATITSLSGSGTYQWINCSDNQVINGEEDQNFSPATNGQYAVIVSEGGCSDTSECVQVTSVGLQEYFFADLQAYPNPTKGQITIQLDKQYDCITIHITNMIGQTIFSEDFKNRKQIELDLKMEDGIYDVEILGSNGLETHMKIIKEN